MDKIKWWDEYELRARYVPAFLSVIPLVHLFNLFIGEEFWNNLVSNLEWMIAADLSISVIVIIAIIQIQCSFAKGYIEESVFGKGGAYFPTTEMLLYTGGLISLARKENIRNLISGLYGCKFSSESEEKYDQLEAQSRAREAVGFVRADVGKGVMTFQYNVRYGFFRNLMAGIIWAVIGSVGCAIIYGLKDEWKIAVLFLVYAALFFALILSKKAILSRLAFTYADTLFNEFLTKHKGEITCHLQQ